MSNSIEIGSQWLTDAGLTVTVVQLLEKSPSNVIVFYTEEETEIKRSFSKQGFLTRYTKL
jgi:hypothetical protein